MRRPPPPHVFYLLFIKYLICVRKSVIKWGNKISWYLRVSFFFLFFCFPGLNLWHMEVPRPGVQSELQLPAYSTTHINAGSLTHWVRPGIEPTSTWILVRFVDSWAKTGTPVICFWEMVYQNTSPGKRDFLGHLLLLTSFFQTLLLLGHWLLIVCSWLCSDNSGSHWLWVAGQLTLIGGVPVRIAFLLSPSPRASSGCKVGVRFINFSYLKYQRRQ